MSYTQSNLLLFNPNILLSADWCGVLIAKVDILEYLGVQGQGAWVRAKLGTFLFYVGSAHRQRLSHRLRGEERSMFQEVMEVYVYHTHLQIRVVPSSREGEGKSACQRS